MMRPWLRLQVALWMLVGVAIGALVWGRSLSIAGRSLALPELGRVPEFQLTDQEGRAFTQAELDGRVWIAEFIFTSCAGQCLLLTDQLRALQRTFEGDDGVGFLSITVDPARDTPEALAAYKQRHGDDPRWRLLTGSREALLSLSRDGFRLAAGESADDPREPITHSIRIVLIDAQGRIRGYYDAREAQALSALRRDARALLHSKF